MGLACVCVCVGGGAGLNDSGGARIHEGVDSLGGYADVRARRRVLLFECACHPMVTVCVCVALTRPQVFQRNVDASGVVPQVRAGVRRVVMDTQMGVPWRGGGGYVGIE